MTMDALRAAGLESMINSMGLNYADFSPSEQECISESISKKIDEGWDRDQAIAASISICAPGKAKVKKQASAEKPMPDLPGGKHKAVQNPDGTWNIEDVAIFAEHDIEVVVKGEDGKPVHMKRRIGRSWQESALNQAVKRFSNDQFMPPLHVHHHGMGKQTVRAGFFKVKAVRQDSLEGKTLWTTFADLVNVPPEIYAMIRQGQLPYRSVEILDINKPEISSLALLDDEVPFFRFKLLTIGQEIKMGEEVEVGNIVKLSAAPALAYQMVGDGERALMYFGGAMKKVVDPSVKKQADEDKDKKNGEKMAAEMDGMKIAFEALKSIGQVAMKATESLAAMIGEGGENDTDAETTPAPVEVQSSAKGAAAEYTAKPKADDKAVSIPAVEKLQGEVDAMKLERALERKVLTVSRELVTYGLDEQATAKKLYAMGRKHGIDSIDRYAEGVKESMESDADSPWRGEVNTTPLTKAEGAEFAKYGEKAVESAAKYASEYDHQTARGLRFSFDRAEFVKSQLRADGFEIPEDESKE